MVAVAPAGAERDHVGVDVVGVPADLGAGVALADGRLDRPVGGVADGREGVLGGLLQGGGEFGAHGLGRARQFALLDDVERVDARVERGGELQRDRHYPGGRLRPVRGDDDSVEHARGERPPRHKWRETTHVREDDPRTTEHERPTLARTRHGRAGGADRAGASRPRRVFARAGRIPRR